MEEFKIIDGSGDRKYFTQIPNMIVNHSTAYEQSLYLIMKRLAGENGPCFASLNFLSSKMGVHKTTVAKTIDKLLKRNWIKEIERKKVNGGMVRQFKIVDLWKLNMDEYKGGAEMTTIEQGGADVPKVVLTCNEGGAHSDTKKNPLIRTEEENNHFPLLSGLSNDYKRKSDRIVYELEKTFKLIDKKRWPRMSFLMLMVKNFGEDEVVRLMGQLREMKGFKEIKDWTPYFRQILNK